MERYTMFLDWKNQYCQNDYNTQGNLRIQCNPYQITMVFFIELEQKNFKICMETQKTQIAKAILRKKNRTGGIRLPDFRLYYKATVMVLLPKQKYRSMEQDRKPRNKPMHLWSPYL